MDTKQGTQGADTRERILKAAEALLRRHGPAKTNVVDVARALDMSHANVYRHFSSKAALMDALVKNWLGQDAERLRRIAKSNRPADERLTEWMLAFIAGKQAKVFDDPEMFEAYHAAAEGRREVAATYVTANKKGVAAIIQDGIDTGLFRVEDADVAAQSLFLAMSRFFHPHFVRQHESPPPQDEAEHVLALLVAGLKAGP